MHCLSSLALQGIGQLDEAPLWHWDASFARVLYARYNMLLLAVMCWGWGLQCAHHVILARVSLPNFGAEVFH
jgi:hypothetical protein